MIVGFGAEAVEEEVLAIPRVTVRGSRRGGGGYGVAVCTLSSRRVLALSGAFGFPLGLGARSVIDEATGIDDCVVVVGADQGASAGGFEGAGWVGGLGGADAAFFHVGFQAGGEVHDVVALGLYKLRVS